MTLRTLALTTLSALALSGCAVGPDYVATPPSPASSGPFLAAGAPPVAPSLLPADWWRLYDDPVLDGLVAGQANKIIAFDLEISPRTVEVYRANVMTKMQARSLSELVRMVIAADPTKASLG